MGDLDVAEMVRMLDAQLQETIELRRALDDGEEPSPVERGHGVLPISGHATRVNEAQRTRSPLLGIPPPVHVPLPNFNRESSWEFEPLRRDRGTMSRESSLEARGTGSLKRYKIPSAVKSSRSEMTRVSTEKEDPNFQVEVTRRPLAVQQLHMAQGHGAQQMFGGTGELLPQRPNQDSKKRTTNVPMVGLPPVTFCRALFQSELGVGYSLD
jgi:hypothetical protein